MSPLSFRSTVSGLWVWAMVLICLPSTGVASPLLKKVTPSVVGVQVVLHHQEELRAIRKGNLYLGQGTGVIVDHRGYVITHRSVVFDGNHKIRIYLSTGEVKPARVIAVDPLNELVLLRLPTGKYPALSWGPSRRVQPGQPVYSVGNVYGSLHKDGRLAASHGVVSDRYVVWPRQDKKGYRGMVFETTAAVNEGAFGAPLVDLQGRLIGMISPSYARQKWLGTAIPAHQLKLAYERMRKNGKVGPGRLAVALMEFRSRLEPRVVVDEVLPGGPGHRGGLRGGDQILRVESRSVTKLSQVDNLIADLPPGTMVEFLIRRQSKTMVVTVELGMGSPSRARRLPPPEKTTSPKKVVKKTEKKPSPGETKKGEKDPSENAKKEETLPDKTEKNRGVLGLIFDKSFPGPGVKLQGVVAQSPAGQAKILPHDKIVSAEGHLLTSWRDILPILEKKQVGDSLQLTVSRHQWTRQVKVVLWAREKVGSDRVSPLTSTQQMGLTLSSPSNSSMWTIDKVTPHRAAHLAGLQPGDILLEVNSRPLRSPAQWNRALQQWSEQSPLSLLIQRGRWQRNILVEK